MIASLVTCAVRLPRAQPPYQARARRIARLRNPAPVDRWSMTTSCAPGRSSVSGRVVPASSCEGR